MKLKISRNIYKIKKKKLAPKLIIPFPLRNYQEFKFLGRWEVLQHRISL